jgi:hypothetical protein
LFKLSGLLFPEKSDKAQQRRSQFIGRVGDWYYNCLILADFNPHLAKSFYYDSTVEELALSLTAKKCYFYEERSK